MYSSPCSSRSWGRGRTGEKGRDTGGWRLGVGGRGGVEYAGWMVWMRVIRGTRAVADEHGGKESFENYFFLTLKRQDVVQMSHTICSSWKKSPIA
jgi:hypothetical protein